MTNDPRRTALARALKSWIGLHKWQLVCLADSRSYYGQGTTLNELGDASTLTFTCANGEKVVITFDEGIGSVRLDVNYAFVHGSTLGPLYLIELQEPDAVAPSTVTLEAPTT